MSEKTEKTDKEKAIDKERRRLNKLLKGMDENKLKACKTLVDRAAFLTVSLDEAEQQLNAEGWTEFYQNGKDQQGVKKSAIADVHISLTKNLNAIMKQLIDLVPPAQRKSKLEELRKR